MKKYIVILLLTLSKVLLSNDDVSVMLKYPAGGEVLTNGGLCTISWEFEGSDSGFVNLYLWNGSNGVWDTLQSNYPVNLTTYPWFISENEGSRFRMKIEADNDSIIDYSFSSGYFEIEQPPDPKMPEIEDIDEQIKNWKEEDLAIKLDKNSPNPFESLTEIQYFLSKDAHISLKLYDINGREVGNLIDRNIRAGWNSLIVNGSGLMTGTYILKLESESQFDIKNILKI